MRILVLGGTRFIGPPAVRRLAAAGHDVTLFHRRTASMPLPDGVGEILGDRRDATTFAALRKQTPDVVLDMMPLGEADGRALVETFRGAAGRVVAISSMDVYHVYNRLNGTEEGAVDNTPVTEDGSLRQKYYPYRGPEPRADDDPARVLDDYDKILFERIVLDEPELPATVLRLPMVYGPEDYQHRLYPYLKRMEDRRSHIILERGVDVMRVSRGFVDNVGLAIATAVTDPRSAGRIYNVAEPEALLEIDWVRAIARQVGWQGDIAVIDSDALPPGLRTDMRFEHHLVADTRRLRTELGFAEDVPFEEGLARTIEWERAHPPASVPGDTFDYDAEDTVLASL